jgi:hypothetical protein
MNSVVSARLKILTAVTMKIVIVWDVTLFSVVC